MEISLGGYGKKERNKTQQTRNLRNLREVQAPASNPNLCIEQTTTHRHTQKTPL